MHQQFCVTYAAELALNPISEPSNLSFLQVTYSILSRVESFSSYQFCLGGLANVPYCQNFLIVIGGVCSVLE
jgi:hypothetical protein